MNVVRDHNAHGYTKSDGEIYYWKIEDDTVQWRNQDHDEVPADVKQRTHRIARVRGWAE